MSPSSTNDRASPYERPAELLHRLIRFDTTNPPGNERGYIEGIERVLRDAGRETTTLANDPERPNLWCGWRAGARHRRALR